MDVAPRDSLDDDEVQRRHPGRRMQLCVSKAPQTVAGRVSVGRAGNNRYLPADVVGSSCRPLRVDDPQGGRSDAARTRHRRQRAAPRQRRDLELAGVTRSCSAAFKPFSTRRRACAISSPGSSPKWLRDCPAARPSPCCWPCSVRHPGLVTSLLRASCPAVPCNRCPRSTQPYRRAAPRPGRARRAPQSKPPSRGGGSSSSSLTSSSILTGSAPAPAPALPCPTAGSRPAEATTPPSALRRSRCRTAGVEPALRGPALTPQREEDCGRLRRRGDRVRSPGATHHQRRGRGRQHRWERRGFKLFVDLLATIAWPEEVRVPTNHFYVLVQARIKDDLSFIITSARRRSSTSSPGTDARLRSRREVAHPFGTNEFHHLFGGRVDELPHFLPRLGRTSASASPTSLRRRVAQRRVRPLRGQRLRGHRRPAAGSGDRLRQQLAKGSHARQARLLREGGGHRSAYFDMWDEHNEQIILFYAAGSSSGPLIRSPAPAAPAARRVGRGEIQIANENCNAGCLPLPTCARLLRRAALPCDRAFGGPAPGRPHQPRHRARRRGRRRLGAAVLLASAS